MRDKDFIIAIDAGGTMTDCVLFSEDGSFSVGKALTNPGNERSSYLESVEDAAIYHELSCGEVHERAGISLYTGTAILNTILTHTGATS